MISLIRRVSLNRDREMTFSEQHIRQESARLNLDKSDFKCMERKTDHSFRGIRVVLSIIFFSLISVAVFGQGGNADYFISDHNYVNIHYEFSPLVQTKDMGAMMAGAHGFWNDAETVRKRIIANTFDYQAIADLVSPGVDALESDGNELLSPDGIWIEAVTKDGRKFSSRLSRKKARQNTWRTGLYYADIHLMDFKLTDRKGDTLDAAVEFILHAFPDKILVEGRVTPHGAIAFKRLQLKGALSVKSNHTSFPGVMKVDSLYVAVWNGTVSGRKLEAPFKADSGSQGLLRAGLAFYIGHDLQGTVARQMAEKHPLPVADIEVKHGFCAGFDPYSGLYDIWNETGESTAGGFNAFRDNPNMYLNVGLKVSNDSLARKLYFKHSSDAGPIEAAILTDDAGFPLPIQVEACKNFGGEGEEPVDIGFNESYFPMSFTPGEKKSFHSLHLHMNWGNHALRQISSIRFFQIYYHLSQGVTETTCFSLPTKFDKIPSGDVRAYTLADYRPLDGQTWPGSPQHNHVALQGWLQYLDSSGKWRYPFFKGSRIYSVGPNLAWFTLDYVSSDNKVDEHFDIFEMPQTDRSRTFLRCTYTFKKDVTIKGDLLKNFRLLNKGSYIRKVHWKTIAWTAPDGGVRTKALTNDEKWSAVGVPLRNYNAFFCAYPHLDGNDALVIRHIGGNVNGQKLTDFGFSAVGHTDSSTELMLTPLIKGNTIKAGSQFTLDVILMPYGDDASDWMPPYEESVRYGLDSSEAAGFGIPAGNDQFANGFNLRVLHGEKVMNLPPVVRARDNWAEVDMKGGNSFNSLVATGFKYSKLPMLWKGNAYLDFQSAGGDGYEVLPGKDGTYGFVFTPEMFTSRANNQWGTRHSRFFITEAWSQGNIIKVNSENGRVSLHTDGGGKTTIMSPRMWCPAINIRGDQPIGQAESEADQISTVPVSVVSDAGETHLAITQYAPTHIELKLESEGKVTLRIGGLEPQKVYHVFSGAQMRKMTSAPDGSLTLAVASKMPLKIVLP